MSDYRLDFSGDQVNNAIKYQSNYNYLLNPDFNINQRECTVYNTQVYSLDRWFLGDDLASATQNNSIWTFAISGASSAGSRVVFEQIIENYNDFASLKVTATIKYSSLTESVSGTTQLVIDDGVNTSSVDLDSSKNKVSVTHTVNASATQLIYKIQTKSTGTNVSIIPTWCKLEIGENSTEHNPRPIGEELWLCQRYYQRLFLEGQTGNYATAYVIQPLLVLPNALRTTPLINMFSSFYVFGAGTKYNVTALSFKKMKDNLLVFSLKTGDNASTLTFTTYDFYCLKNGEVSLDAEIYPNTLYTVTTNKTTKDIYYAFGKNASATNCNGLV